MQLAYAVVDVAFVAWIVPSHKKKEDTSSLDIVGLSFEPYLLRKSESEQT